jgi:quercetin dioxygenase-like cupin family protein
MSIIGNSGTASNALHDVQLLDAQEVEALSWTAVAGCAGVSQKVLWHLGGFTQALIHYEPGASTPGEPHLAAHHHVWVTQGELTFAGRPVTAGSYAHVPPGEPHPAGDVGPEGCTLLQMHRPHPPLESESLVDVAHQPSTPYIPAQAAPRQSAVPLAGRPPKTSSGMPAVRLQLGVLQYPGWAELDGVWWPRSLDLVAELQPLLEALPTNGRHARGVMYNLGAWNEAPHKVTIDGRVIKLGGYRMLDPDVVHLTASGTSRPLVLRVVPPGADPVLAAAQLAAVCPAQEDATAGRSDTDYRD